LAIINYERQDKQTTLDDGKPERRQAGKVRGKNFGLMRTKERGSYGKKVGMIKQQQQRML
jgi:hypothetical protein